MRSSLTRRALLLAAPLALLPRAARGAENPDPDAVTREHLTAIHKGLVKYLKAHDGVWPQSPSREGIAGDQKWWPATLEPYGVKPGDWTDPRDRGEAPENRMTYSLASFGKAPGTAFLCPDQPWAMTSAPSRVGGDFHLLFPDGRVMTREAHLAKVEKSTPLPPGAEGQTVRRMRNIRNALYKYLRAHDGVWPQEPEDLGIEPEDTIKWLQKNLGPHGTKPEDWEGHQVMLSAIDDKPYSAHTWLLFPWLISSTSQGKTFLFLADGRVLPQSELTKFTRKGGPDE